MRHGQGYHGIADNGHNLRDPHLTGEGQRQCREARAAFTRHDHVDLLCASPLRRAIQTCEITFAPVLAREAALESSALDEPCSSSSSADAEGSSASAEKSYQHKPRIIALPMAEECSAAPSDTGSDVALLEAEFPGVDFSLVRRVTDDKLSSSTSPEENSNSSNESNSTSLPSNDKNSSSNKNSTSEAGAAAGEEKEAWYAHTGFYATSPRALIHRAAYLRRWLCARPEKEIVLVAHGFFNHYLTGDVDGGGEQTTPWWGEAEVRTFVFCEEGEGEAWEGGPRSLEGGVEVAMIRETEESLERRGGRVERARFVNRPGERRFGLREKVNAEGRQEEEREEQKN